MSYRKLSDGEAIQGGDEFRIPLVFDEWQVVYPSMVGKTRPTINSESPGIPNRYAEFRRPVTMKLVYVAGPFRAENAWEIEENIRRAERLALGVWRLGAAALCPHANTRFFQGAAPDEVWLKGDLEMLRRCDAVVLASGWMESSGTRAEIRCAVDGGIPVFDSLTHLDLWLRGDAHRQVTDTKWGFAARLVPH